MKKSKKNIRKLIPQAEENCIMDEYKDKYLDHLIRVKGVCVEYVRTVKIRITKFMQFLKDQGIAMIEDVTREHLYRYQETIMKSELSVKTKRDELRAIALFFKFLYDYDYIKENPGLIIDPPKKVQFLPRNILGEHEISYLLRQPDQNDLIGIRDFCIMSLLYSSMMRTKEIFNLKLGDIDFRLKQVLVRRPKNKQDRIVHIDTYTTFFIKKYINKVRPWLLKDNTSDNLFISAIGSNLTSYAFAAHFTRRYRPIIKEKFKKDVSPYSFRHSSATHWLDSGAKKGKDILPFVQRQLGHQSLESTAIYTHVAIEPLRQMFKQYHPRELNLKQLHKIPSPDDIISPKRS